MAGNAGAAAQIANVIIQDYLDRGPDSAYCQYVEFIDDGPGGWHPAIGFARDRFCNPPPPPEPPASDFFDAGGVPCRLYQVTFATGTPGGSLTNSVVNKRGPIGLITKTYTAPGGAPGIRFYLTSGDGQGCPRLADVIAGTDNRNVSDVTARIVSIVPLEGDPATEVPVWRPPTQPPNPPIPPLQFNIDVNVDGVEVNAPIRFGPVINTPFGPTIQINFSPTANFNPDIDVDLGLNPSFGLDVDLEFVLPFSGGPTQPAPIPGEPPVPLPPVAPPPGGEAVPVDYDRIENIVESFSCCKPATNFAGLGTFTFETPNQVFNIPLPSNAVIVFIAIIPGDNTRAYKLAGLDAEYGHGNASITTSGDALGFERIYVNNHAIVVPEQLDEKGLRLSLKQGTIATVSVGTYVPVEEV